MQLLANHSHSPAREARDSYSLSPTYKRVVSNQLIPTLVRARNCKRNYVHTDYIGTKSSRKQRKLETRDTCCTIRKQGVAKHLEFEGAGAACRPDR
jgi:hypothetical protein